MQVSQYLADFPLFYNLGIKFVGPITSYVVCSSTAGSNVAVCLEYKIIFVIEYYLSHPLSPVKNRRNIFFDWDFRKGVKFHIIFLARGQAWGPITFPWFDRTHQVLMVSPGVSR